MRKLSLLGIENLGNAVIMQTVNDYRETLVKEHRYPKGYGVEIKKLEKFFTGPDFEFWCLKINGERLMKMVKREVEEFNYDLEALYASHKKYIVSQY